jgi:hypothetical protein
MLAFTAFAMEGRMFVAKIAILMGAIIALFGTVIDGVNYLAVIVGLCLLVGGLVGYLFEKDKS